MAITPPRISTARRQPIIDYVTKDYEGFRQGMLNQIPLLLPEWTDRSESDFGVVLIELFAYVADILSYYQDRVANEAYLSTATQRRSVVELLRLVDYRIDPGLSASAYIHFDVTADVTVPALPPYQLKTEGVPGEPDRIFEITEEFTLKKLNSSIDLSAAGLLPTALPTGGQALRLPHNLHALSPGVLMYFEQQTPVTGGSPRIRRSPILRVVQADPVSAVDDIVTWLPPLPDPFSPALTKLKGNNVRATHGETVTNEPIVIGDGTPGQRMTLSRQPVTHVLAGATGTRRSTAELEVRVNGELWDEVGNFIDSAPSDTHYVTSIDENDYLTVVFGTGDRGSVVPAGAQITARYRIGLGSEGNVGSDRLTVFLSSIPEVSAISNPFNAEGGADRESLEEAKISGPGSVIAQQRAVTIEDYEMLS